jgi:hypothetical protein
VCEEVQIGDECDVGRIIIPSKQNGPVRAIVWNCMELDEEQRRGESSDYTVGEEEAYASRSVYARSRPSRVYVFTPLPPLLAPLYGTDTFTRISIFTSVD